MTPTAPPTLTESPWASYVSYLCNILLLLLLYIIYTCSSHTRTSRFLRDDSDHYGNNTCEHQGTSTPRVHPRPVSFYTRLSPLTCVLWTVYFNDERDILQRCEADSLERSPNSGIPSDLGRHDRHILRSASRMRQTIHWRSGYVLRILRSRAAHRDSVGFVDPHEGSWHVVGINIGHSSGSRGFHDFSSLHELDTRGRTRKFSKVFSIINNLY